MSTGEPITHVCQGRGCNTAADLLLVTREGPHRGTVYGRLCSYHGQFDSTYLFDIAREILCAHNDKRHLDPRARYEVVPDRCSHCSAPLSGNHYAGPMCRACRSDERERAIAESVERLAAAQEKALEKALEPAASRPDATEALEKVLALADAVEKSLGPKPLGDVIREALENAQAQFASRTLVFANTASGSSGWVRANNTLAESSGTPEGASADPVNHGAHEAPLAEKADGAEASVERAVSNLRHPWCAHADDALDRTLGYGFDTAAQPDVTHVPYNPQETTMPTPAPADPTNTTPATPRHGVSPKVYASGSPNGSSLVGVLRNDANDAAWRLAGSQFVKLTRDPLAGALTRHLGPGDESLRARIAAFLETELGTALLASILSAGLSALPQGLGPGDVTDRLARELRVRAMAGAGDVMADVLMGPLREVMAMYLRGVPETEPGRTEGPPGLPEGTNGLSNGDAALHVEARVVEPAKVSP